jgi:hypothetical protein
MVVALVALFVALGGGSYAAVKLSGGGVAEKPGALESGETLKGLYHVSAHESGTEEHGVAEEVVTFQQPLRFVPERHFISLGSSSHISCPGTATRPKADPGHLCVYEADTLRRDPGSILFIDGDARDKLGFLTSITSNANQDLYFYSEGSWAVTAP